MFLIEFLAQIVNIASSNIVSDPGNIANSNYNTLIFLILHLRNEVVKGQRISVSATVQQYILQD